jgi:hypothetical protein
MAASRAEAAPGLEGARTPALARIKEDNQGRPMRDHDSNPCLSGFQSPPDFGTFRAKNHFIGSGVVEAGCRSLIGKRCKQSGLFWGEPGADKVLAFRRIHTSRRMDSFWKDRLNSRATENDSLPLVA